MRLMDYNVLFVYDKIQLKARDTVCDPEQHIPIAWDQPKRRFLPEMPEQPAQSGYYDKG